MNEEQLKKDKELLKNWKEYEGTKYHVTTFFSEGMGHQFVVEELLEAQARVTEAEVRREIIQELEEIEKQKWADAVHCTCLGFATHRLKCNCDNDCGKCRITPNPKQNE